MEGEIMQMVSMGFADYLAAQALEATNGSHHPSPPNTSQPLTQNPPSPPSSTPLIVQHKINQSLRFHSEEDQNLQKSEQKTEESEDNGSPSSLQWSKRQKVLPENLEDNSPHASPLSERMRPRVLDEVVGQDHLLARDSLLRSTINCGRLPSIVLWGPPGTGKTSIAKAIVSSSSNGGSYRFISLSAVTCGVKGVRNAVEEARKFRLKSNKMTVLFLDEVHRFNKTQQDSFLPVIEDGSIVFIGATTENPSFHLITPLLSRCRVLTLNPLKPPHLVTLVNRAVSDMERGLAAGVNKMVKFEATDEAIEFLASHCDGDARVVLNALEISSTTALARTEEVPNDIEFFVLVTIDDVKEALQCKHLAYDRSGDEHYNLTSALIKSMRGSDADAAIYWLSRMLEGGEDPLYIARRLIIFASEDIGLADVQALTKAVACYQACHFMGMPECNVILAQCVVSSALAPKSDSICKAIGTAQKMVRESAGQNEGVPLHLRNAPNEIIKELGYGKEYVYPPDNPDSSSSQTYLPPSLEGYKFLQ